MKILYKHQEFRISSCIAMHRGTESEHQHAILDFPLDWRFSVIYKLCFSIDGIWAPILERNRQECVANILCLVNQPKIILTQNWTWGTKLH